ncbi:MAG: hypothetical protein ACYDH6_18175 [Acidimicrobiales bacterium]
MGYRGLLAKQDRARELRATGMTMPDIATALGVSKGSVSLWTRDVEFEPRPRRQGRRRGPNKLQLRKQAEIDELLDRGHRQVAMLGEDAFFAAGIALYAGEGSKRDGRVVFANCDPRMVVFFVTWLRRSFDIDESRLRMRVYLHEGLDLEAAQGYWSELTGIPLGQFRHGYRAPADATMRHNKHEHGCAYVQYSCSRTHRAIMGLVDALLSFPSDIPG